MSLSNDSDFSIAHTTLAFDFVSITRMVEDHDDDAVTSVEKTLKLGTKLFGNLTTTSALPTLNDAVTFPSPVKDALSETESPKNHLCYEFDWKDDNGKHWSEFKPVTTTYTAFVIRKDLLVVLNLGLAVNGDLVSKPTWVSGTSRSDFVKCQFAENKSDHFFPKQIHDPIHNLKDASGTKVGTRGGKKKLILILSQW